MKDSLLYKHSKELGRRFLSFNLALKLIDHIKNPTILETGTVRHKKNFSGDGQSTLLFGEFVSLRNGILYTIDIDPASMELAKKMTKDYQDYILYITSDSLSYLNSFNQKIDLVYLDSLDYSEQNPADSQLHCLKEGQTLLNPDKLGITFHRDTVILIDDADLKGGGKPGLLRDWLKTHNWICIYDDYQCLWVLGK